MRSPARYGANKRPSTPGSHALAPDGLQVERWLPKAGLGGRVVDLRVVVIAGQYTDAGSVTLNPHVQINRKHVEIRGCWGCDYSHFHRALQVLAHQGSALPWLDALSSRFSLEQANEALAAVAERSVVKALIVPN